MFTKKLHLTYNMRGNEFLDAVVNTIKARLVSFWFVRTTTEEERNGNLQADKKQGNINRKNSYT